MTPAVISAILLLQERSARQARSAYWAERIDLALDDLTRNPHRTGNPRHLARNALSEAGKRMHRRRELARMIALEPQLDGTDVPDALELACPASCRRIEAIEAWVDAAARLRRVRLLPSDRNILRMLMEGATGEEIARALGVIASTARVRIHNARRRAERVWSEARDVED